MAEGRRPITDDEREPLRQLGARLRTERLEAGLTLERVGEAAALSPRQVSYLEAGGRRTRHSTLERLVVALRPNWGEPERDVLVLELVALAGPALAEESPYRERIERARLRRARRERRRAEVLLVAGWLHNEEMRARRSRKVSGEPVL